LFLANRGHTRIQKRYYIELLKNPAFQSKRYHFASGHSRTANKCHAQLKPLLGAHPAPESPPFLERELSEAICFSVFLDEQCLQG
jgi:hypothetical protein